MKTGLQVADVMIQKPVTVSPTASLFQCSRLMREKKVGSLIVREEQQVLGFLTEEDIVRRAVAEDTPPKQTLAKDIMSDDIVYTAPADDIFLALSKMRDHDVRHLPVLDDGTLVGIVTLKDILTIQPDLFEILAEKTALAKATRRPQYQ